MQMLRPAVEHVGSVTLIQLLNMLSFQSNIFIFCKTLDEPGWHSEILLSQQIKKVNARV